MHPDIKLAVDLQVVDKEIARLSAEVAYLPRHIQEIESKLAGAQRQLDNDRKALAENQKERKKLEGEVPAFQQKISKYKGQMFDVKTNEEYKALQHEIEYAEGEIRKIEDRILERMIAAEEIEARVRKAEKQLAAERGEVEKEKAQATERTRADEAILAEQGKRREEFRRQMSEDAVHRYDRLFRARRGTPVSELREGACSECNVRLRPQALQETKTNDRIRECENCGRILYYVPPPEPQEAAEPQEASNQSV